MKTGEVLKYYRKQSKLTQITVSKELGKSQQWISDIENDVQNVLWGDMKKLCKLYNITPDDIAKMEEGH